MKARASKVITRYLNEILRELKGIKVFIYNPNSLEYCYKIEEGKEPNQKEVIIEVRSKEREAEGFETFAKIEPI